MNMNTPMTVGATSRNPATGDFIAHYPFQTAAEVERMLESNAGAYRSWRAMPMEERVATYRRLAVTLRSRSEALASLITAEMGKTIAAARAEVEKCAAAIDWIAEHGPAFLGDEPAPVEEIGRASCRERV